MLLIESTKPKLYRLSTRNLNGQILSPSIPNNFLTANGYEDTKTPRVCFAPSIDFCLRALSMNLTEKKFYVYIPVGDYEVYTPKVSEVPDSKVTHEKWITKPIKVKCIGKIKVTGDAGEEGLTYSYGDHTAELYDWNWEWIEKLSESEMSDMLLFGFDDIRKPLFEVDINGQPANNQDDDDAPTDYTAGDDEGAEDTGAPADDTPEPNPNPAAPAQDDTNPTDNPEDYTLPDNEDQGDEPPGGAEGTAGAATADYTANAGGATGGDAAPAATDAGGGGDIGGDMGGGAEAGDTGGGEGTADAGTTDYTAGGGGDAPAEGGDPGTGGGDPAVGGGDPGGGAEGGGDPGAEGGDDMGGDAGGDTGADDMGDDSGSSGDGYDQQIQDLEKDIYEDLTEPQMDIRNKELKRNFASLYDLINDIIERINDMSKDTASVKPLEFVCIKLNDLAERVSDYLINTYSTKSYTENEINYNLFLVAAHQINDILAKIRPENS